MSFFPYGRFYSGEFSPNLISDNYTAENSELDEFNSTVTDLGKTQKNNKWFYYQKKLYC